VAKREDRTWGVFVSGVHGLLEPTAEGKGYNVTGVNGQNELFEFVQGIAGSGHALGEIVYKVKRYAAKRQPEDLLKIAAWAFLEWRHQR
jgi:hypothetical protein